MEWSKIGDFLLDNGLPLLGGPLGGPAGAPAGKLAASVLGIGSAAPDQVMAAIEADPEALLKLKQLESDHALELRRMVIEAETARHAETNRAMRAEAAASDAYVRRWRPTIGYVVAFQMALLGLAVFAAVGGRDPGKGWRAGRSAGRHHEVTTPICPACGSVRTADAGLGRRCGEADCGHEGPRQTRDDLKKAQRRPPPPAVADP